MGLARGGLVLWRASEGRLLRGRREADWECWGFEGHTQGPPAPAGARTSMGSYAACRKAAQHYQRACDTATLPSRTAYVLAPAGKPFPWTREADSPICRFGRTPLPGSRIGDICPPARAPFSWVLPLGCFRILAIFGAPRRPISVKLGTPTRPILVDTGGQKQSILVKLEAVGGPILVNFGPPSQPLWAPGRPIFANFAKIGKNRPSRGPKWLTRRPEINQNWPTDRLQFD